MVDDPPSAAKEKVKPATRMRAVKPQAAPRPEPDALAREPHGWRAVAGRVQHKSEQITDYVRGQLAGDVRGTVARHPFLTVLAALGVGLLFGFLLRGRSRPRPSVLIATLVMKNWGGAPSTGGREELDDGPAISVDGGDGIPALAAWLSRLSGGARARLRIKE